MNNKGLTIPQIVALVFIIFMTIVAFLIFKSFIGKEKVVYITSIKSNKPDILLNGNFTEFTLINEDYEDKGVSAYTKDGKNISNYVITKIYDNNHVVTKLDTSKFKTYKITYTVTDPDDLSLTNTVSRVVIVTDTVAPKIILPKTSTITSLETINYDLEEGVSVNDNSEVNSFTYDNTLKPLAGKYIITYKASDIFGNTTVKKRLIKVTDSIDIKEQNNKLIIKFPIGSKKNYSYKYSLDNGITWIECSNYEEIDLNDVIAGVYEDGKFLMALSYKIKQ